MNVLLCCKHLVLSSAPRSAQNAYEKKSDTLLAAINDHENVQILKMDEKDEDLQNVSTPLSTIPKQPGRDLTTSFS
jgi:hypothetical protein